MNRKEYESLWLKKKKSTESDKGIKAGDQFFVIEGKMAGTIATALSVHEGFVYARHKVTNVEFRCRLQDIEVRP